MKYRFTITETVEADSKVMATTKFRQLMDKHLWNRGLTPNINEIYQCKTCNKEASKPIGDNRCPTCLSKYD